jgi:hypothetical protein
VTTFRTASITVYASIYSFLWFLIFSIYSVFCVLCSVLLLDDAQYAVADDSLLASSSPVQRDRILLSQETNSLSLHIWRRRDRKETDCDNIAVESEHALQLWG